MSNYPSKLEPGVEYLTTEQWGAKQSPPIGHKRVTELLGEGRIEGAVRPGRDILIPASSERLPPTDEARAKWREKTNRYMKGRRRKTE